MTGSRATEDDDAALLAGLRAGLASEESVRNYEARLRVMVEEARMPPTAPGSRPSIVAYIRAAARNIAALEARMATSPPPADGKGEAPKRAPARARPAGNPLAPLTARTVRNRVTAVLAALRHAPPQLARRLAVPRARWAEFHARLRDAEDDAYKRNVPLNARQTANYVSMREIEARLAELLADPEAAHRTRGASQQTLLLAFYAHTVPKRADLGALHIFGPQAHGSQEHDKVPADTEQARELNYVLLSPGGGGKGAASAAAGTLVLNAHKTAQTHGAIEEPLPAPLVAVLLESLRRYPRAYVFAGRDGRGGMTRNAFSQFVAKTFAAHFGGRAAGPSLLRHVYVSERVDFNNSSVAEREGIAKRMGHSLAMQDQVYHWIDRRDASPRPAAAAVAAPAQPLPRA